MRVSRRGPAVAVLAAVLLAAPAAWAQGSFEFGIHYGRWSLNLLRPVAEDLVGSILGQIEDKMVDRIRGDYPELSKVASGRDFGFDSGGPNYGFEMRWYPGGQNGSFSLGLAVEQTTLRVEVPSLTSSILLRDAATSAEAGFDAEAGGVITCKPLAFLLSFRWDLIPEDRIHPYITLGLGLAGESAMLDTSLEYHFAGILTRPDGGSDSYSESSTKTIRQLIAEDKQRKTDEGSTEEPFDLPIPVMPFLQFNFGLKAVITPNIHALVDFGVLDGFVLRGGLAIRI